MERDYTVVCYDKYQDISTHTLTWSVTVEKQFADFDLEISTHTLTWSVTLMSLCLTMFVHFNSHAHVERDYLHGCGQRNF